MHGPSSHHDGSGRAGYDLRAEFAQESIAFRVLLVLFLVIGAIGGLGGGYLLLHETRHWVAWFFALAIVEPVGVACAVALVALVAPESFIASLFRGALKRAIVGAFLLGFAFFAFIIGTLAYST